jgi:excisionase family DNA binding protein
MKDRIEAEPLLTPAECAALFRVDVKTLARWGKTGKLHSVRTLGGHRRFYEREVRALIRGEAWELPADLGQDPMAAPVGSLWPADEHGVAAVAMNRLAAHGVLTVGQLAGRTAADLRDLGLRRAQVDEVRLALHRKGLALRGEVIDAPLHSVA